ncbi:THO complex subunit 7 homolog [Pollicipes pollicipes]|uniref:THO complex subunit 7 homolog n=1 Tax=Pollicipes pollicipes TaxID=41117 RepID=UPI0018859940|nr:THO complex subunit 7 homolog [Pollicipes pollicipes]XP_037071743.1 THO complex subunit 7 homolog [Pollicipes pollicipes]
MSDEEVIRRRLMIDGDGTGDDRRLNMFLKNLTKWAMSDDASGDEGSLTYERLMSQLSQCEFSIAKSQQGCKMNAIELENYETLYKQIDSGTELVKAEIVQAKEELNKAKQIRRNRMEYDALAKVINQQPDRKETEARLAELKAELQSMQACQDGLDAKLEMRRKQFHVLVTSIHQLQQMLDEEQPEEGADCSAADSPMDAS